MAEVAEDGPIRITELEERQKLKQMEDRILDLQVILSSTLDTIIALLENYRLACAQNSQHPSWSAVPDHEFIPIALEEKRRDILLYCMRIESLRSKVQGTSQLVRHMYESLHIWPL